MQLPNAMLLDGCALHTHITLPRSTRGSGCIQVCVCVCVWGVWGRWRPAEGRPAPPPLSSPVSGFEPPTVDGGRTGCVRVCVSTRGGEREREGGGRQFTRDTRRLRSPVSGSSLTSSSLHSACHHPVFLCRRLHPVGTLVSLPPAPPAPRIQAKVWPRALQDSWKAVFGGNTHLTPVSARGAPNDPAKLSNLGVNVFTRRTFAYR